jgi:formylglycine-generating enzyme required for sulfatase activity
MPAKARKLSLDGGFDIELLSCPAGIFTMGSPAGEPGRSANEAQHQVTISKPFWLGKTEVTQGQWQAVMGNHLSQFKGVNLPVEKVSWDDAVSFCKKLTERAQTMDTLLDGYEYRLPTEAEWEYACRAGSTGPYAGTGRLYDMGWHGGSNGNSGNTTHVVGTKQPNAWGLVDMHGNVFEWCQDWYGDYPTGAVTDPTGPVTGDVHTASRRVRRGGCWPDGACECRAAHRDSTTPDSKTSLVGFRVAFAPAVR